MMKKNGSKSLAPDSATFIAEAGRLAVEFGWPARSSEQASEVVLVALTKSDPAFERFVWIYDTEQLTLRCMLVGSWVVPQAREQAVLELCARINEGLPFGCIEYSFSNRALVFRDSADLDWGPLGEVLSGSTARVLNLGRRYAASVQATLDGTDPEIAVQVAEKGSDA
jgi:hypothetical protein